ncbi:MAG: AAA family ATPase [Chitinophagaceae bacterium]
MIKAFVFGKFLPFHKGHEAMIKFALDQADFVSVLICRSNTEIIDANTRVKWIEASFRGVPNMEIRSMDYNEDMLPNSSVSSRPVSEAWSVIFRQLYPDYSIVITSEPYGAFIAEYMKIRHIIFDPAREFFPVSASAVRKNLQENWHFLTDAVKRDHLLKVVILGTESTGKTTLGKKLADHFGCNFVSEAGREIVQDSRKFEFSDLVRIAEEHAERIEKTELTNSPLVMIDTDIHITKSYARFAFGRELIVGEHIYRANKASLYLYLSNDAEYIQDGTRLNKESRDKLDTFHRQVLKDHHINYVEISGDWSTRFEDAKTRIQKLLAH